MRLPRQFVASLCLTAAFNMPGFAQPGLVWTKTYMSDASMVDMVVLPDGGFAMSINRGTNTTILARCDTNGDAIGTSSWSGSACHIQRTSDGGFAMSGGGDYNLKKTNSAGTVEWSQRYYTNCASYDAEHLLDGSFVLVTFNGGSSSHLIHTNAQGESIRDTALTGTMTSVALAGDVYYVGGHDFSNGRVLISKHRASDDSLYWANRYGSDTRAARAPECLQATNDGGCIMGGYTGAAGSSMYAAKVAADGTQEWGRTYAYGGTGLRKVQSVKQTADGGYLLCSFSHLLAVAGNGEERWSVALAGMARDVEVISDGEYNIGGWQGTGNKIPFVARYSQTAAVRGSSPRVAGRPVSVEVRDNGLLSVQYPHDAATLEFVTFDGRLAWGERIGASSHGRIAPASATQHWVYRLSTPTGTISGTVLVK